MYASISDLDTYFGTDEMAEFDNSKKEAVISSVSGLMDTYFSANYATPLDLTDKPANTVNLIKHICCSLTRCNLYDDLSDNSYEVIKRGCDGAMDMLDKIKSGQLRLAGLTIKPVILHHQNTRLFSVVSES